MEYKVRQYSIYSSGQRADRHGRPMQEDCIYPPTGRGTESDTLFVVCDGMGDDGAGLQASTTVCHTLAEYIDRHYSDGIFSKGDMIRAIDAAHDALDAVGSNAHQNMGTTLAALRLTDQGYVCAHMGDSRIYHIRPGRTESDTRILHCSEDHTLANHLLKKGEITIEEALTSPKRHVITRAMQPNMTRRCQPEVHVGTDVRAGDYFMLCTDGMLETLSDDNIRAIFSADGGNAKNKAALLNKATQHNNDNHSAIIVYISAIEGTVAERTGRRQSSAHDTSAPSIAPTATDDDYGNQYDSMDHTDSTQGRERRKNKVSELIAKGDIGPLVIKFLFILMGLLILIMLIYYLFIRTNETLQTAGTAVDDPLYEESEVYGYEITEEDVRNEARPVAPEEIEPVVEDEADDSEPVPQEPLTEETPQQPERPSNEPILLE